MTSAEISAQCFLKHRKHRFPPTSSAKFFPVKNASENDEYAHFVEVLLFFGKFPGVAKYLLYVGLHKETTKRFSANAIEKSAVTHSGHLHRHLTTVLCTFYLKTTWFDPNDAVL